MIDYGAAPTDCGHFPLVCPEAMYFLYLPIHLRGIPGWRLPRRLLWITPLIEKIREINGRLAEATNVYVTAKHMYVDEQSPGNRPGWHADGFGSGGDVNYVWSNRNPTQYAVHPFGPISEDDRESMKQMTALARWNHSLPDCHLARLTPSVVHRVSPNVQAGWRSFVKITLSEHQFRGREILTTTCSITTGQQLLAGKKGISIMAEDTATRGERTAAISWLHGWVCTFCLKL